MGAIWQDRPSPPLGSRQPAPYLPSRAKRPRPSLSAFERRSANSRPMRWWLATRMRSPGPSTSVAPTCSTPRWCSALPSSARGRPAIYVDGRKLNNTVRAALEALADARAPEDFTRDLAALGSAHKTVRLDRATAADAINRIVSEAGGHTSNGDDPIALMKAVRTRWKLPARALRTCATASRVTLFPRLVRPRSRARQARRNRCGRSAGRLPAPPAC